jgi:hypothetical protein
MWETMEGTAHIAGAGKYYCSCLFGSFYRLSSRVKAFNSTWGHLTPRKTRPVHMIAKHAMKREPNLKPTLTTQEMRSFRHCPQSTISPPPTVARRRSLERQMVRTGIETEVQETWMPMMTRTGTLSP